MGHVKINIEPKELLKNKASIKITPLKDTAMWLGEIENVC